MKITHIQIMKHIAILFVAVALFSACNGNKTADQSAEKPVDKTAELTQTLAQLDKEMGGASPTDKTKALEFIKTAEELGALVQGTNQDQYVDLMLKAGGLAKTIEEPRKAVELYHKVAIGLPKHPKAPTALFMLAFVYENDMRDPFKAKAAYEAFLERYPNDPDFTDDAQNALKQLGKTPEELAKQFEQQSRR